MKTRKILSLISALVFALAAPASLAEGLALTDMAGREITLDAPATRVIALNPADCEILYALGAEDVLVGRGEYCNYPEAVLELPSVNSGAETNIEQILALEPDVIVMSKMAQTVEQVEALEAAGVRVVISDAQNLAGVYDAIAMLGELTASRKRLPHSRPRCRRALTRSGKRLRIPERPCTSRFLPWSGACGPAARILSWTSWRKSWV